MTDTLTVCDTPISKDQIHAVAARLREGGHDKSDDEIETSWGNRAEAHVR